MLYEITDKELKSINHVFNELNIDLEFLNQMEIKLIHLLVY